MVAGVRGVCGGERMSEGWRGVALATGSGALVSPAGANRDNEGVLRGSGGVQ